MNENNIRRTIFVIAALLLGLNVAAQNISVKSFQPLPMDMTAASLEGKRLDQNGKAAALLKVVTTETGFAFEGGKLGIIDSQQQVGEIWVWVPFGLRKITIRHPKLGALENYYLPFDIESERTYEMILAVAKEGESLNQMKKGAVSVKSNVPASFYIDDKLIGKTPMYYADLTIGEHTVRVVAEGYSDYSETIQTEADDVIQVKAKLEVEKEVTFNCNVADADLFINGKKVGKASGKYGLKYGEYTIKATAPSHDAFNGLLKVDNRTTSYAVYLTSSERFTIGGVTFAMKKIDGGNFMMGSKDPYADYDEKPMHPVIVDDFYMSETEVTQALWAAVLGTTSPCYFLGNDLPVNNVTVEECERFITELNRVTKRKFRLPTEAEWEYAARGGTTTSLYNGEDVVVLGNNNSPNLDPLGWYPGNCGRNYTQVEGCDVGRGVDLSSLTGKQYQDQKGGLHPVGKKVPNAYGLYDMLGNVAEWCSDFYGPYTPNTCINPKGPKKGYTHVLRGGSFEHKVEYCRVSSRGVTRRASAIQETRHYYVGLRLVLEPK